MHALKQPEENAMPQAVSRPAAVRIHEVAPANTRAAAKRSHTRLARLRGPMFSAVLWIVSLAALFAFWYFGTLYRWDFYIRFTNIPTPAEVFRSLLEVNRSDRFATNVGISLRRILSGFGVAMVTAVPRAR